MPSASAYTSKMRALASARNVKVQYPGGAVESFRPDRSMMCTSFVTTIIDPLKQVVSTLVGPETLSSASSVVVDKKNNVYVGDNTQNCIFKVDGFTKEVSLFAGIQGSSNSSTGNGLDRLSATFYDVDYLALNPEGDLFVCESGVGKVRKIDMTTGIITQYAGLGGVPGFSGDGGLATQAVLNSPSSITFDSVVNMYIADTGNNRIRKVNTAGIITTIAGRDLAYYEGVITGDCAQATSATLNSPKGIVVDSYGNIFIADTGSHLIRVINARGYISTLAGLVTLNSGIASGVAGFYGDGGFSIFSKLNTPTQLALDSDGNLYIADSGNNRVRYISATTKIIKTLAGTGTGFYDGDGKTGLTTSLNSPQDIAFGSDNTLFITDSANSRLRTVSSGFSTAYTPSWFTPIDYLDTSLVYNPVTKGVLSTCRCEIAHPPDPDASTVPPPNVCVTSATMLEGGYSALTSNIEVGPEVFGENIFYGGDATHYD